MTNGQRWLLVLILGFLGGCVTVASDNGRPSLADYLRHGLIGMGPTAAALKMTLEKT